MTFENLSVAQLVGALAAFAAALAALHFLRIRRRRVRVSSIRLWRELAARARPRILWQSWRDAISYTALLSIGALLLFALAGPVARGESRRRSRIIVLDTGLSMQAREANNQRRSDLARKEAERLLAQLGPDDRAALITAGIESRALIPFGPVRTSLRDALRNLEPAPCRSDLEGAIELAESLARGVRNAEVIVISDRVAASNPTIRNVMVGTRPDNVAITGLELEQPTVNSAQAGAKVWVTNATDTLLRAPLIAALDGNEAYRLEIEQAPRSTGEHHVALEAPRGGRLAIRVDADDALPEDNQVEAQLVRPGPIHVLVVGDRNGAVARALQVDAELRVSPIANERAEVIVENQGRLDSMSKPTLFVTPPAAAAVQLAAAARASGLLQLSPEGHPVTLDFAFKDVKLSGAVPFHSLNPLPSTLATVEAQPVLIAGEATETRPRFIAAGWNLNDESTGFSQRPQFVAFIARAVRWLAGHPRERALLGAVGQRSLVELARDGEAMLTLPNGTTEPLGNLGERFEFVPRHVGIHKFTSYGSVGLSRGETVFLSSVRAGAAQADIKPARTSGPVIATRARSPWPAWIYMALAALGLLLLEWVAFLRRVTV